MAQGWRASCGTIPSSWATYKLATFFRSLLKSYNGCSIGVLGVVAVVAVVAVVGVVGVVGVEGVVGITRLLNYPNNYCN